MNAQELRTAFLRHLTTLVQRGDDTSDLPGPIRQYPADHPAERIQYKFIAPILLPPRKRQGYVYTVLKNVAADLVAAFGGLSWSPGGGDWVNSSGDTEREPHLLATADGEVLQWHRHVRVFRACLQRLLRELYQKEVYFGIGGDLSHSFDAWVPSEKAGLPSFEHFGPPDNRAVDALISPGARHARLADVEVSIAHLPTAWKHLYGRTETLHLLNKCWNSTRVNIVCIIGGAGDGKTAIVKHWLRQLNTVNYWGASHVFAWSFYTQGITERVVSADPFFAEAFRFFGDDPHAVGAPWQKGERLANLLRGKSVLLILDGLEALQYPPGSDNEGRLKDHALATFLTELVAQNRGLCVITTRLPIPEIAESDLTQAVRSIELPGLDQAAGVKLLRALHVIGEEPDLRLAVKELYGHPLSLILLGSYLVEVCGRDILRRSEIPALEADARYGDHARRILAAYSTWLRHTPQILLLRLLSLFDRPISLDVIHSLLVPPGCPRLTRTLIQLPRHRLAQALEALRRCRLVLPKGDIDPESVDLHPLIREHFRSDLQHTSRAAFRCGNSLLADHYKAISVELPHDAREMETLLLATIYACRAGRYTEALHDLYLPRIQRGSESYASSRLALVGEVLFVLSHFFVDHDWSRPVDELDHDAQLTVIMDTASQLTAVYGYAHEAVIRCYHRGMELARQPDDQRQLLAATLGLIRSYRLRAQLNQTRTLADQLVALAERAKQPTYHSLSDRAFASYYFYRGQFDECYQTAERGAKAQYSQAEAWELARLDVNEPVISCMGYQALAAWFLGKPQTAIKLSRRGVELANDLKHPHTRIVATFIEAMVGQFTLDKDRVDEVCSRLIGLCTEYGNRLWRQAGEIFRAWARQTAAEPDEVSDSLGAIDRAMTRWLGSGARLFTPYWLAIKAEVCLSANMHADAAPLIDQALNHSKEYGEYWWDTELYRLRAECISRGGGGLAASEAIFWKAVRIAEQQNADSLKLRALVGLVRKFLLDETNQKARESLVALVGHLSETQETSIELEAARRVLQNA